MPTLSWIGKKAVENHHRQVPFHLLKNVPELSVGEPGSGNLIVEGDNLLALKALLPFYAGQIKCIYIDPPYNTGKEGWIYNDNVNSPEMREWLGRIVGNELDDLCRHDKWLCMMYPRLALAKQFLAPDGAIFISIDDTELPVLRLLMDELFPHAQGKNRLACFVWQTEGNFDNQAKIKNCHEYVLAYSKRFEDFPPPPIIDPNIPRSSKLYKPEIRNTIVKNGPNNPVSKIFLPAGFPASIKSGVIKARQNKWPHYDEDIVIEDYKLKYPLFASSGWSSKDICEEFIRDEFKPVFDSKGQKSIFEITKTGAIETVKKRDASQSHVISVIKGMGSTQSASQYLSGMGIEFDYPKPVELIRYLLAMIKDKSCFVLDFFAGSGTTAQAVIEQNISDEGSRKFILVEVNPTISREIIAQRLNKIINGYDSINGSQVQGVCIKYRYATLGESLFDENGNIRSSVKFSEIAKHVFFVETGEPLLENTKYENPLVGVYNGVGVYLLYNGILHDKSPGNGNVLTTNILHHLPKHEGIKIVYGTACRLGAERLRKEGIVFKQLPYKLKIDAR